MKKFILILGMFFLFFNKSYALGESAYSYIVMDMDNGDIILSKNKDKSLLIASITKIMTCIIAIENYDVNKEVIIPEEVKYSYGSGIYIKPMEKIKMIDLLYGLMLRSGNDAAIGISILVSGSEEEFVNLMNKKAMELGMKNTSFYNASGLDKDIGNTSSVYDMALLTRYAMKNSLYRKIVGTKKYKAISDKNVYIWHNKNKLLNIDYVTGGKTGYTEKAKRTLVTTGYKNNINLVIVTIRDSDDWNTHKKLYEYVFNNYYKYKVIDKDKFKIKNDYYNYLYVKDDYYLLINKNNNYDLISKIVINEKDNYKDNSVVGYDYIYLNNKLIKKIEIYNKKEEKNSLLYKIKRLFGYE